MSPIINVISIVIIRIVIIIIVVVSVWETNLSILSQLYTTHFKQKNTNRPNNTLLWQIDCRRNVCRPNGFQQNDMLHSTWVVFNKNLKKKLRTKLNQWKHNLKSKMKLWDHNTKNDHKNWAKKVLWIRNPGPCAINLFTATFISLQQ